MSAVSFIYANWIARYPEFTGSVASPLASMYFNEATLYCDNTDASPVCDVNVRATFLNMLTAHIAALNAPLNGVPSSPIVGRIASASEGSVSVQTQNDYPPGTAQWFQQTKYGSAYWAASAQFRIAQYMPGPTYDPDPYGNFFGGVA